jgi:hypothetical protein
VTEEATALSWSREKKGKVIYTIKHEDYTSLRTTCLDAPVPSDPKLERRMIFEIKQSERVSWGVYAYNDVVRDCAQDIVVCGFRW